MRLAVRVLIAAQALIQNSALLWVILDSLGHISRVTETSFSIIVTCYNQSVFIQEAVQSALSQTYPAKQVIVVDDASTDDSVRLLKQYEDSITIIARSENGGASAARNLGALRARGDYLVFLDGDDVLLPWALELYASVVAARDPRIILGTMFFFHGPTVLGSDLYFRGPTPVLNYDAIPSEISVVKYDCLMKRDRTYRACASAIVVDRNSFEAVSGWTDVFPVEDQDLMLKLGYAGRAIQIVSPATICCRVHEGNTMSQAPRFTHMLRRVIARAHSGVYARGARRRLDAYALVGGSVFFWLKRAFATRCYAAALDLFLRGWPFILIAAIRRLKVAIAGRHPIEVLPGLRVS